MNNFDAFARTTLAAATNSTDGKPLTTQQISQVIEYLNSSASGPDGVLSYAKYLDENLNLHPPKLSNGISYVGFSGKDNAGVPNYYNARDYIRDLNKTSGVIGDTAWGVFIESTKIDPEFEIIERNFTQFMQSRGFTPFGRDYAGALQDIMWNAGSPQYFENAIANGKPIVAFVENAPPGRGFSNFELPTALRHPNAVINGYPVSAFGDDPLTFVSRSAAEFQQLERAVAQAATANSGRTVHVAQVRAQLNLIEGFDAVGKTVFGQPIEAFKTLNLEEMTAARSAWMTRGGVLPSLRSQPLADTPERTTRIAAEPGAPRGPPTATEAPLAGARTAAQTAPDMLPGTLSPSGRAMLKGAGAAGVALLAYDLATTGHQVIQLRSQGNATGADSAMTHFAGRSVGGIAGGFLLGAGYGAVAGVETGPGMIVTGLVGGVIGAYAGEQWAQQRDNDKIYKQTDANGNQWTRDPDDPKAAWTRTAQTQQLKQAPGQQAQVTARTDADGDAIYRSERYVATGHLARQLNYQSANASYELGLANPQTPRNPYSLPGEAAQQPGWHAGNWNRDAQTGAWSRVLVGPMPRSEFQAPQMQTQAATPQQQAALEAQSRIVIAQNAANTPAAIAARYQIAYNQFGWEHAGPVPEAIRHAAANTDTLQASDGNQYKRGTNGEWISDGWLGNAQAQGNIRNELNAVHQSQQAGLADMAAIAQHARAHPQPPQDALRDLVATAYQAAGVARTVAELDAAVAAVRRDHERDGLGNRGFTLRLLPDPAAADEPGNRAIATLATDDDGQMVIRSVTTPQEMRQAQDAPARSAAADARGDAQRDDAASPGMEAGNPLQQSRIGQLLDRYFDAAARGDAAALAQTARDYEKTPEYRQWEQWGQDNHQQLQAEQRQLAQQQQQSQGRAL